MDSTKETRRVIPTNQEIGDAIRRTGSKRCHKCGRVVTWRFQNLGLGVATATPVRVESNGTFDVYWKSEVYHTFPCVGRKIQLKDVLAHYLQLVNSENASHAD